MILRPATDVELIEGVREILSDSTISLDTRAMIALLVLSKDRATCPAKSDIGLMLAGDAAGEAIGTERLQRMVRDAKRGGYFVRSRGQLEGRPGRANRYWYVVAGKTELRAYADAPAFAAARISAHG